MENGPNFTDGKDLHMVGAYNCLMVQTPANQRYLWLVPLRHHPNRARDSFPPSRLLTHKRCSHVAALVHVFLPHSDTFRREVIVAEESIVSFVRPKWWLQKAAKEKLQQ